MSVCVVCDTSLPENSRFCPSCGTPVPGQTPTIGIPDPGNELLERMKKILAGRFEIRGELGRGGMASVLLARQVSLDRELAIKVLNPALNHDSDLVQRFIREARTQGRLDHPGIIQVYEVYQEGGLNFYTMPRIQGPSLRQFLKQTPRPPIDQVRRFLRESAEALGYAHRQGLIHRDVKPENMLLDEQKHRLILTDFGIAKTLSAVTMLTVTGEQLGTPRYMSPDQGDSKRPIDGRSDQYSLGLVGYEMLAGHMAFQADNLAELMYKHRYEDPEPLDVVRPDAPAGLASAIMRAIRKNRDERFDTMDDFVKAMSRDEAPAETVAPPAGATVVVPPPVAASAPTAPSPGGEPPIQVTPPPVPGVAATPGPAVAAGVMASQSITPPPVGTESMAGTGAALPVGGTTVSRPGRRLPLWIPLAVGGVLIGVVALLVQTRNAPRDPERARVESEPPVPPEGPPAPLPGSGVLPVPTPKIPAIPAPGGPPGPADSSVTPTPEAWARAQAGFNRYRQGLPVSVDSLVAVALAGRYASLDAVQARAESLADAGRFDAAVRSLADVQGSVARIIRQNARERSAAATARTEVERTRRLAIQAGAQEKRAAELGRLDQLRDRADGLLAGGRPVDAEKAYRESAREYAALAELLKSQTPTPGGVGSPTTGPVGGTGGPVPSAEPGSTEQEQEAIRQEAVRFGRALATENLGHLRAEFPKLELGRGEESLLTAIFDRTDQLAITTKRSNVRISETTATADAEYELTFLQSRTREPGRQAVKLRLTFTRGAAGWDLVRMQRP